MRIQIRIKLRRYSDTRIWTKLCQHGLHDQTLLNYRDLLTGDILQNKALKSPTCIDDTTEEVVEDQRQTLERKTWLYITEWKIKEMDAYEGRLVAKDGDGWLSRETGSQAKRQLTKKRDS